jgi:hypothetical protein
MILIAGNEMKCSIQIKELLASKSPVTNIHPTREIKRDHQDVNERKQNYKIGILRLKSE